MPLRGGEVCDRCDQLAVMVTEHLWRSAELPPVLAPLLGREAWCIGPLMWCSRHVREHELGLLTAGAVVLGVRGGA